MRKIVINNCYGGFSLSQKGLDLYNELSGKELAYSCEIDRSDEFLVKVVETLGSDADGNCAKLKVVEIPEDVNWSIEEYDGLEHVAEKYRIWY